ncbi:MAG: uroporphyrinogen-III synthase [Bacteroidota bacterium]
MMHRPLQGRHIVVTRSADQADVFAETLRALGASPLLVPSIQSAPAEDAEELRGVASTLGSARWLGFTSPSGVRHGWPFVLAAWPDGVPDTLGIAAVGPGTASALSERGVVCSFLPSESTGDAFAAELAVSPGDRVVLMRSDIARRAVAERLRQRGASVVDAVAYRTIEGARPSDVSRALEDRPDAITFTSPSTVRGFMAGVADVIRDGGHMSLRDVALVAIGPVTAEALRDADLTPTAVADPSTLAGLADALVRLFS